MKTNHLFWFNSFIHSVCCSQEMYGLEHNCINYRLYFDGLYIYIYQQPPIVCCRGRAFNHSSGWTQKKTACYAMLHRASNFAGSCEHCNELLFLIKGRKFLDYLSDY
jgi:hypothetical protein